MKKWRYAVCLAACCISISGCSRREDKALVSTVASKSIPATTDSKSGEVGELDGNASSTMPNFYEKTYIFNDNEFNSRPVPFQILRLSINKTYKEKVDEERLHLIDLAWRYLGDIAKKQELKEGEYEMEELEYLYELKDQLLYMPVYLRYREKQNVEKERLYNLIFYVDQEEFHLIGETDRAILNEEQYPKERVIMQQHKGKEKSYLLNKALYNSFFSSGKRIEDTGVRAVFLKQLENHVRSMLTDEDIDKKARIGVVDLIENSNRGYIALMEVVFYEEGKTVLAKRYQVINSAGTLKTFEFNDLGVYDNIIDIDSVDYQFLSCKSLYDQAEEAEEAESE